MKCEEIHSLIGNIHTELPGPRGHSGEIDREAVRGRQNKIDEKPAQVSDPVGSIFNQINKILRGSVQEFAA